MSQPPAHIPEQPWTYPPAEHPRGHGTAAPIGGYYARGGSVAIPSSPQDAPPIWEPSRGGSAVSRVTLFTAAALGVLVVLFFVARESGFSGTFVGIIVALIPLAAVLTTVMWVDRWEPEPRRYLILAFAWGAGVATGGAMFINTRAFMVVAASSDATAAEFISTGIVAPIAEEVLKGSFLIGLLIWRSRLMNSAVDLIVYSATIASGFAFTENVLYFARGASQGMLGTVFFGRAIMSPFAHIIFTSALAIVLATVMFNKRTHLWWAVPTGLAFAILLHAAWNITAILAGAEFFTVFLSIHVPVFVGFVATVIYLRRRERRNIISNLRQYADSGWFAGHEVDMLGSLPQRAQARSWASRFGVRAGIEMAEFQRTATALGLNRQRMLHASRKNIDEVPALQKIEAELLREIQAHRLKFLEFGGPGAVAHQGQR